jgi:ABC transporter substrate binding protein
MMTTQDMVAGPTILKIVCVVAILLLAAPLAAEGQKTGKVYHIGVLDPKPVALNVANLDAFRQGMREFQYAEGQNFVIQYRSPEGRAARFPDLAHELVRSKVDLILTRGTPAVTAAKNATRTIPIAMAASGDPVGAAVVTGLARPGGNVTGLTALTVEVSGKRLQLPAFDAAVKQRADAVLVGLGAVLQSNVGRVSSRQQGTGSPRCSARASTWSPAASWPTV